MGKCAFIFSGCLRFCPTADLKRNTVSGSLQPHRPWNSPGQNTGVGSLSLPQGNFQPQGSNPGLPHCRWTRYQLSHQGRPLINYFNWRIINNIRTVDFFSFRQTIVLHKSVIALTVFFFFLRDSFHLHSTTETCPQMTEKSGHTVTRKLFSK